MHTQDFDYPLPQELIAQAPLAERDASRLLHVRRRTGGAWGSLNHRSFRDLPSILRRGDLLVLNDSRVIPARLLGRKAATGGAVELLLVRPDAEVATQEALAMAAGGTVWRCLGQASKGLKPGARVDFGELTAEIVEALAGGEYRVRFTSALATLEAAIERAGRLPLPPYIERAPDEGDAERYQTVFAEAKGSVAAPTAGLHFTQALFEALSAVGVDRTFVTLEVGPGTFLPVREGELAAHRMHAERFTISELAAAKIQAARHEGRRVVAVGTTVVRTLESAAVSLEAEPAELRAGSGETTLFITPGFQLRVVDALLTNFHLPKSTLLMLVCAVLGREQTLAAYAVAVRERYRFFSYGDAMFIEDDDE